MLKKSWIITALLLSLLILPSLAVEDNPVIAEVGDEIWRMSDFNDRIENLPDHYQQAMELEDQRIQFLDQLVREYQIYLFALDNDMDEDEVFQRKMEYYRINTLAMMAWEQLMGPTYGIPDEELREYYDNHPEKFMTIAKVRARHMLFDTEAAAVAARERLDSGEITFGELAKEVSVDPKTNRLGGMLGLVEKNRPIPQLGYTPELNAVLFELSVDSISAPVKTDLGWHLAMVEEKIEPAVMVYDQILNAVVKFYAIPEDEALEAYRAEEERYTDPEEVALRIIVCSDEDTIDKVHRKLNSGASFAELAKEFSEDETSGVDGGSLGFMTRDLQIRSLGSSSRDIIEIAFNEMNDGEFSEPLAFTDGWVIVQRDAYRPPRIKSFEEVENMVRGNLMPEYGAVRVKEINADLEERYPTTFYHDTLNAPPKPQEDAAELYELAEVAPPPTAIDYYENILKFYPESPEAAKSQFMIGFLYSDKLKNYDAAEKAFNAYLENWSDGELAESASYMLEHMRDEEE